MGDDSVVVMIQPLNHGESMMVELKQGVLLSGGIYACCYNQRYFSVVKEIPKWW